MKQADWGEILTAKQAAKYLGMCERLVRELKKLGTLPYVQLSPGRIGFRLVDLEAFVAARLMRSSDGIAAT